MLTYVIGTEEYYAKKVNGYHVLNLFQINITMNDFRTAAPESYPFIITLIAGSTRFVSFFYIHFFILLNFTIIP